MVGALAFLSLFWLVVLMIIAVKEYRAEARDRKAGKEFYSPDTSRLAGWTGILGSVTAFCVGFFTFAALSEDGEDGWGIFIVVMIVALFCLIWGIGALGKPRKINYPKGQGPGVSPSAAKPSSKTSDANLEAAPKAAPASKPSPAQKPGLKPGAKPAAAKNPSPGPGQIPTLFCGKCGGEIAPDHQFCPACGAAIKGKEEKPPRICSGCGEKVEDGQVFCPYCGSRM